MSFKASTSDDIVAFKVEGIFFDKYFNYDEQISFSWDYEKVINKFGESIWDKIEKHFEK
jgi:hypothetical protein